MIKFFRQIRKSLLMENNTGKYFKYAIGEIVLVVIGILIALSINNWNENRKQKETLNSIYSIVKEDLQVDIVVIDSFIIDYNEVRKPAFETVLRKSLNENDLNENKNLRSVVLGYKDFTINQRGFELLKTQFSLDNTIEQNLTAEISKFYNLHLTEINLGIDELSDEFKDNLRNLRNQEWFSDFAMNEELTGFNNYILNNSDARNRITLYYILFNIYANELIKFKTEAEKLTKKIDLHLSK